MTAEVELALIGLASLCVNSWVAIHQAKQNRNITKIEVATNSMKDALVQATAAASRLSGMAEERQRAQAEKDSNSRAVEDSKKP